MNLDRRVALLETRRARHEVRPCPACGIGENDSVQVRAVTRAGGEAIDHSNDRCPACGRTLVFHLEFDKAG